MDTILKDITDSVQKRFVDNECIKSFDEFLKGVQENPKKFCRSSAEYLKDVFDCWGSYMVRDINGEEIPRWRIFDDFGPVYGQERAQGLIYNHLSSFAEHRVNKIVLLHGPNGSAKTSLVAAIMQAMEAYTLLPEGAVYTFNWIFSDKGEKEVGLGFGAEAYDARNTLAFVEPEDVTFKLACGMKDSPLFLIPKKERLEFLSQLGLSKVPQHLIDGELNQKSHEIYNRLNVSYKGDWIKIIRHVQVERFYFSKRFRKGLISIDPQKNMDASSRALNLENSYKIPPVLSMTSMHEPFGDLIDANRGIVEFSEIFKRHPETNKYLLTTAEWGTINLPSFTGYLDCVIFATDNESQLSSFKLDSDWPSFNGRLAYVRVPYLLQWEVERNLYKKIISDLNVMGKHVAPHTEDVIALWAVMTRLRVSEDPLGKKLTYIQKAEVYSSGEAPNYWRDEDRKNLLSKLGELSEEFEDTRDRELSDSYSRKYWDASYEGRSGASYREVESVIIRALHNSTYNHLSPLSLFDSIGNIAKDTSVYEFLRLSEGLGHIEAGEALEELTEYFSKVLGKDIRDSAGLVAEDQYLTLFENYISHVKAWISKEKILNSQTGDWEDPSSRLFSNVETLLEVKEDDAEEWRYSIFNKIAAWFIDNPEGDIPYKDLFSDSLEIIKKATYQKHREQLLTILRGSLRWDTEDWDAVEPEDQKLVIRTMDNMRTKGYSSDYLKEAVVFLLKREGV
jgi:predicted Ser/Thr protein kinase